MSGQIFISYRREDTAHAAGRLYEHLAQKFPKSRIFLDIDNLDPGEVFATAIKRTIESCQILIAVIGRHWLDARDADGNRRLDDPNDFVRLEITSALKRGIRVMPVLVDGAVVPKANQLPSDLQPIVDRQAVDLSYHRFASDSERIIDAINRAFKQASDQQKAEPRTSANVVIKFWQHLVTKFASIFFVLVLFSFLFPFTGGHAGWEYANEGASYFFKGDIRVISWRVPIPVAFVCPIIVLGLSVLNRKSKVIVPVLEVIVSWIGLFSLAWYFILIWEALSRSNLQMDIGLGGISAVLFQTLGAVGKSLRLGKW